MARNYSPNHPAVRAWLDLDTPPRPLTVRERRAAVNARAGRSSDLPPSRFIVGVVALVATIPAMAWGDSNGAIWMPFLTLAFSVYCFAPWIRQDMKGGR